MIVKSQYLLLWLEAPLQSWGADSKFGRRDSLDFPTKSGVAGLLLCALGASGEQQDLLAELAPLKQTAISYQKQSAGGEFVNPGLVRDFHMVGSAYDKGNAWETLHVPKKSDGTNAVGGGVKMTYRYYIQSGFFAAIVEIPAEMSQTISAALMNPVFDIYLGRKSCVPTDMVYRGSYDSEEEAAMAAAEIAEQKELAEVFRVRDAKEGEDAMNLNDVPIQFGAIKKYRERRVALSQCE